MRTERIYPYQLEEGDLLLVSPKEGPSYSEQIVGFKRTRNAVSYTLNGQFYHFGTVGRAKEGKVVLTRVVRDHTENPYPYMTPTKKLIVDELCSCGRLRSEHGPGAAGAFGHGSLESSGCPKFTFARMIDLETAQRAFDAAKKAGELSPPGSGMDGLLKDVMGS